MTPAWEAVKETVVETGVTVYELPGKSVIDCAHVLRHTRTFDGKEL